MKKLFYSQKLAPYVFVLPFALTVVIFWMFPIGNGILLSFQDVLKNEWVGLGNYQRLLSDKIFLKAVYNSAKYMVGTLVLLIPFPMLFATLLNSKLMKKPGLFKSIYFIPALTSVVVAGTIFRLMFGEMNTSLANQIIAAFGMSPIKWLKGEWTSYFALLLLACLMCLFVWMLNDTAPAAWQVRKIMNVYILSWAAGFVIPGAPGGIGVREVVITYLTRNDPIQEAVLLAMVVHRISTVLGDLFGYLWAKYGLLL